MRVFGIDFTSRPSAAKPITCAETVFDGSTLHFVQLRRWPSFDSFEMHLDSDGPWVTGIDAPFSQSRTLVENLDWPLSWTSLVGLVAAMTREDFRVALKTYRAARPAGQKHHKRACDKLAGSQSPQSIEYVPVGLMFYEVAPRILNAPVHIPHLRAMNVDRVVLEAYPGVMVRSHIGRRAYKSDKKSKRTKGHSIARNELLSMLLSGRCEDSYGFKLQAPLSLADDPTGDDLDALLCAVQAAWAWNRKDADFGAPGDVDLLEGWICDPALHR